MHRHCLLSRPGTALHKPSYQKVVGGRSDRSPQGRQVLFLFPEPKGVGCLFGAPQGAVSFLTRPRKINDMDPKKVEYSLLELALVPQGSSIKQTLNNSLALAQDRKSTRLNSSHVKI